MKYLCKAKAKNLAPFLKCKTCVHGIPHEKYPFRLSQQWGCRLKDELFGQETCNKCTCIPLSLEYKMRKVIEK
jgi:hypothetical protein